VHVLLIRLRVFRGGEFCVPGHFTSVPKKNK